VLDEDAVDGHAEEAAVVAAGSAEAGGLEG
jgi:hypothetical protein